MVDSRSHLSVLKNGSSYFSVRLEFSSSLSPHCFRSKLFNEIEMDTTPLILPFSSKNGTLTILFQIPDKQSYVMLDTNRILFNSTDNG